MMVNERGREVFAAEYARLGWIERYNSPRSRDPDDSEIDDLSDRYPLWSYMLYPPRFVDLSDRLRAWYHVTWPRDRDRIAFEVDDPPDPLAIVRHAWVAFAAETTRLRASGDPPEAHLSGWAGVP